MALTTPYMYEIGLYGVFWKTIITFYIHLHIFVLANNFYILDNTVHTSNIVVRGTYEIVGALFSKINYEVPYLEIVQALSEVCMLKMFQCSFHFHFIWMYVCGSCLNSINHYIPSYCSKHTHVKQN